jgi:cytosine/adenosine deaminase-related metal-dependent hydrolase
MSTFFHDALLVQLDPPRVEAGNLRVADGRIVGVGSGIVAQPGDEIVECGGAVLMPGMVNGHTHLYSALAAGMPAPSRQPRNFHEILQFIWWRLDRAHTLESVEVSGQIGALAAIRCGTTTLIDHHASPNAIDGSLAALENGIATVGCRGVLCYEVTDRNRTDEAQQGLRENERYAKQCAERADGRFAAMVGAHASFTLEEDSLAGCVDLASQLGVGVHIHAAEDPVDERITRERYGAGLIERFARVGLLEVPETILAHGTHFSVGDFAAVNANQAVVVAHNPSSNMNNGVGYTPVAKLTVPPLLGTDGIGADMWREARIAEFKSHDAGPPAVVRGSPDPAQPSDRRSPSTGEEETFGHASGEVGRPAPNLSLPFGESLKMLGQSARFASKCLGLKLGELEMGAAADLVLTSYRPATPLAAANLAGHFLFAMGPEFMRDVMVGGWWVMRKGHVVTCDEAAIRARSVEVARALHERMATIP